MSNLEKEKKGMWELFDNKLKWPESENVFITQRSFTAVYFNRNVSEITFNDESTTFSALFHKGMKMLNNSVFSSLSYL